MITNPEDVCDCGYFADKKVVKKEGPNKGREFFVCPAQSCNYFRFADSRDTRKRAATTPISPMKVKQPKTMTRASLEAVTLQKLTSIEKMLKGIYQLIYEKVNEETDEEEEQKEQEPIGKDWKRKTVPQPQANPYMT